MISASGVEKDAEEDEGVKKDEEVKMAGKAAEYGKKSEPKWNIREWLRSIQYEDILGELLEKEADASGVSPLELVKLGTM